MADYLGTCCFHIMTWQPTGKLKAQEKHNMKKGYIVRLAKKRFILCVLEGNAQYFSRMMEENFENISCQNVLERSRQDNSKTKRK